MAYVKVADRPKVEPSVDPGAPGLTQNASKTEDLQGLVKGLQSQIDALKTQARAGTVRRDHVKEHTATLREFAKGQETLGIVTRIYSVKEVKDKTENKRFYGICEMDVLDPRTGENKTYHDVNYLDFLDNAKKVLAKIVNWSKDTRYEIDPRRGGGGVGSLSRTLASGQVVTDNNFEFEVSYVDHRFTLLIQEGEFEGLTIETDEKALNL